MICPKCNNSQQGDEECESCGIVFRKYFNSIVKKKLHEAIQLYDEGKYQVALASFNAIVSAQIYKEKQIDEKCEEYIKKIQETIKIKEEQRSPIIKNTTESVFKNICPDCTTPINDGDKFCHNCGKPVKLSTDKPIDVRGDTEEKISYFSIKSLRVSKVKAIIYFTLVFTSLILLVFIEKMYHKRTALSTPDASSLALTDSAYTPPVKTANKNPSKNDLTCSYLTSETGNELKWGDSISKVNEVFPNEKISEQHLSVNILNGKIKNKIYHFWFKKELASISVELYENEEPLVELVERYGEPFKIQKNVDSIWHFWQTQNSAIEYLWFKSGKYSGTKTVTFYDRRRQPSRFPSSTSQKSAVKDKAVTKYSAAETCDEPPNGLVCWLPGDSHAKDAAGTNHGQLRNGTAITTGMVGQGFRFNGSNDYIEIPNSPTLNLGQHTIEAWIHPEIQLGASYHGIVVKQNPDNSGRNYYLGLRSDGRIHYSILFTSGTLMTLDSNVTVPKGKWSHIAANFDGSVMNIFYNGALCGNLNVGPATPVKTTQPLLIGHSNELAQTYFRGQLDEVAIYNRALSDKEIHAIFNNSGAGKCNPQKLQGIDSAESAVAGERHKRLKQESTNSKPSVDLPNNKTAVWGASPKEVLTMNPGGIRTLDNCLAYVSEEGYITKFCFSGNMLNQVSFGISETSSLKYAIQAHLFDELKDFFTKSFGEPQEETRVLSGNDYQTFFTWRTTNTEAVSQIKRDGNMVQIKYFIVRPLLTN